MEAEASNSASNEADRLIVQNQANEKLKRTRFAITDKMTFSNTEISTNDMTTDLSIGRELSFAIILFFSQCTIFWCLYPCLRNKMNANALAENIAVKKRIAESLE